MAAKKHNPTLADLPSARVVTVGDVIVDYWHYGRVERISPEAPVPVFAQERVLTAHGGAGNVVANLAALGITADANVLVGGGRWRAPQKHRYVVDNQQIFRCDVEEIRPIEEAEADAAYRLATASNSIGCLILSDYGKGMLTPALCRRLIRWARMFNVPVVVDPKGPDWSKYDKATVITPNEQEWQAIGDGVCDVLDEETWLLLTRGAKGMTLWSSHNAPVDIPAQAREVFDVTGAGDTVVAVLAAAMAVGFELEPAARLANAAAGVVVGKRGTAVCSLEELEKAFHPKFGGIIFDGTPPNNDPWYSFTGYASGGQVDAPMPPGASAGYANGLHVLEGKDEADVIAMVREKIARMKPAGDIGRWERGWAENLEEFRRTGDVAALRPKYIRDGQPLRMNGKFVIADDPDYEWHWYEKFFAGIAEKWLRDFDCISEFGAGSCHNVAWLAKHFPVKEIWGFDWSQASVDICWEMHERVSKHIFGQKFDFFNPTDSKFFINNTAVLTVGALEQTGKLWRPFLNFLLREKPARVVHIEPIVEWYDTSNPVDLSAIMAHRKRGFWEGYVKTLEALVEEGKVAIEHMERTGFGSLMIEGYSQIVWRPL